MRQRERKQENTLRQKTGWLFAQWETLLVLIFLLVNIININPII
jgi:rhamnose transport system permease protein